MKKRHSVLPAIMGALLFASMGQAQVISLNGGFETGDFTGWQQFPSAPMQQSVGGFDPTEGSFAARLFNTQTASASLIKNANIGIGVVTPGAPILISFDARGVAADGGVAFAEFFSEIDPSGTSKTEILGGAPLALNADPAVWTSFVFNTTAGPDVSGGVTLQLTATTGGAPSSVADIYYDNISVSVVPEPGSFALLGLGAAGLIFRRRRRCV